MYLQGCESVVFCLLVKCKIVHITSLVLCGCTLPSLVSLLLDCSCQVVSLEFWDFLSNVFTTTLLLRVDLTKHLKLVFNNFGIFYFDCRYFRIVLFLRYQLYSYQQANSWKNFFSAWKRSLITPGDVQCTILYLVPLSYIQVHNLKGRGGA